MRNKLISLKRIANTGLHNFFRNAWLSTAATAIMVVTLSIILGSVIINRALTDTIDDIAQRVTASIYLKDDIEQEGQDELRQALLASDNVKAVDYVSKQDALAIFQEQNQDDATLLEAFTITGNDALPASFEVTVVDLGLIDEVSTITDDERFADVVDETSINETRRASIDNIAKAQDFINLTSIMGAAVFAAISILIIFNTIRMAVFTRSEEIEIMKLIGATPGYIRGPFLFEAAFYGIFAGVVSTTAIYSILLGLGPSVNKQLLIEPTIDYFSENLFFVLLTLVALGVLIGLLSSRFAMSRYLRLKSW